MGLSLEVFCDDWLKRLCLVGPDQNVSAVGFECVVLEAYILTWERTPICQAVSANAFSSWALILPRKPS